MAKTEDTKAAPPPPPPPPAPAEKTDLEKAEEAKLARLVASRDPDSGVSVDDLRAEAERKADEALAQAKANKEKQKEAEAQLAMAVPEQLKGLTPDQIRAYLFALEGKPVTTAEALVQHGMTNEHINAQAFDPRTGKPTIDEALKAAAASTPGVNSTPLDAQDILVRCIKGEGEVARMGNRTYELNPKKREPIWMLRSHALELAQKGWVVPIMF